jgi:predicted transcriptional regulator
MMIRTMVQLTEEQMKALKELAKARKTSVAKLVRESVAQYVAAMSVDKEERRRRMLAALEAIDKAKFQDIDGATDVSVNHDKYLAEIYGTW